MAKAPRLTTVGRDDALATAVERLYKAGVDGLPVLEDGSLVGMLTRRSVGKLVHERTVLLGGRRAG